MCKREYEMVLNHHDISPESYAIGESAENRLCFTNENDKWQVFRVMDHKRTEVREFQKEMEACAYFFQILLIERELEKANAS